MNKIVIPQLIEHDGIEMLKSKGYEVVLLDSSDPDSIRAVVNDADAILIRNAPLDAETIRGGKKLKVISRHGVGVESIDIDTATSLQIQVTNTPLANNVSVAEHVIMLLLALSKNINKIFNSVEEGRFQIRHQLYGAEIEGKVLFIVGFGKIGRLIAQKAHSGLNMKVSIYDPFVSAKDVPDYVKFNKDLYAGLREADFVTLNVPLVEATNGFFDTKEIEQMKQSAFLINCARAEVLNEQSLALSLNSGRIAGAAIDVFRSEPPEAGYPLLNLPNVILTPHYAAHTKEAMKRMAIQAATGIIEVLEKKPVSWPVNRI